jgi:hypothetical protein
MNDINDQYRVDFLNLEKILSDNIFHNKCFIGKIVDLHKDPNIIIHPIETLSEKSFLFLTSGKATLSNGWLKEFSAQDIITISQHNTTQYEKYCSPTLINRDLKRLYSHLLNKEEIKIEVLSKYIDLFKEISHQFEKNNNFNNQLELISFQEDQTLFHSTSDLLFQTSLNHNYQLESYEQISISYLDNRKIVDLVNYAIQFTQNKNTACIFWLNPFYAKDRKLILSIHKILKGKGFDPDKFQIVQYKDGIKLLNNLMIEGKSVLSIQDKFITQFLSYLFFPITQSRRSAFVLSNKELIQCDSSDINILDDIDLLNSMTYFALEKILEYQQVF